MDFEIQPATYFDRSIFRNLMHLYLYDFSEYEDEDVNEQGLFEDQHLDRYWTEPGRYAFLVKVNGKYAGFVMVRDISAAGDQRKTHSIAEFFIMKKYRRHKIGQRAACQIFDRFPGHWQVCEMESNLPAQEFWRRVIGEYTQGRYQEVRPANWHGPAQEFDTPH